MDLPTLDEHSERSRRNIVDLQNRKPLKLQDIHMPQIIYMRMDLPTSNQYKSNKGILLKSSINIDFT